MSDKEKLLKVLQEIGVDTWINSDEHCERVYVRNENYDIEENRVFDFKFDKKTGKYFE